MNTEQFLQHVSRPLWSQAPFWARYLARDMNGKWWWFQNEPTLFNGKWLNNGGSVRDAVPVCPPTFETTLEERPHA